MVPIRHYAAMLALDSERFSGNGSELERPPFYQHPVWGSEGGSVYDVTPIEHMQSVRRLGERCHSEVEEALKRATKGLDSLRETRDVMKGIALLSIYYEKKVNAAVAALVYSQSGRRVDRERAEILADEALASYLAAAEFMHLRLDPYYQRIAGTPLLEAGVPLPELIAEERRDREQVGEIFGWK